MRKMTMTVLVVFISVSSTAQTSEEAVLRAFINDFFTEFSRLSAAARVAKDSSGHSTTMPLINHSMTHFVKSTETSRATSGEVPEVDLVAKLVFHGPKSWEIKDVRVAGDVARADVTFLSLQARQSEPIPFTFRFIRSEGNWKFLRSTDKRPKTVVEETTVALPSEQNLEPTNSAGSTLKAYLDFLVANRTVVDLKKPATIRPAVKKIGEEIAALWRMDAASKRARNEATTKLLFQDIESWLIIEETLDGDHWTALVEVTMGKRNPMAAFSKIKPKMTFEAENEGGSWFLVGFSLRQ